MKPGIRLSLLLLITLAILLPFIPLVLWSFSTKWFYPNVLPNVWGTAGLELRGEHGRISNYDSPYGTVSQLPS